MKQTLFAWLLSGLYRVLGVEVPKVTKTSTDYSQEALYAESNRPIEQIINEGSLGEIENTRFKECYGYGRDTIGSLLSPEAKIIKTQAEQDYEYLKGKNINNAIVTMTDDRYINLIKLAYINEEVDKWLESLHGKLSFIFLDDLKNIGIVHG